MATPFHVELVTPERVLFSGETDEVTMRTDGGEIAFLAHHEDFVGAVDISVLSIHAPSAEHSESSTEPSGEVKAAVHGGFVNVGEHGVTIMAGVAELADEIDVERARQALATSESRIEQEGPVVAVPESHGEETTESTAAPQGAMLALSYPESPLATAQRARVRLEAAGTSATS